MLLLGMGSGNWRLDGSASVAEELVLDHGRT